MRIRTIIVLVAVVFISASCASTSFSYPQAHIIPEDFFGISPDRTDLEKDYMDIHTSLGAVWIRTTPRWTGVEKEEGVWDFSHWDEYVEKAEAAGKKIMFILAFDNTWLYKDKKEHRNLGEKELPYFLKYVEQIVTRYKGRIHAYEIWNEPNGWFWYGSDKNFFALSAATAKKVKEIDPDTPVLAGALFRTEAGFLRGMYRAGAIDNVDGISLHPYSANALNTLKQVDKLRNIMAEFNDAKPVWISEVGYPTEGAWFSACDADTYPQYIVKTLSGLAARDVRNVIWYELMDAYNPEDAPDHWNPSHFFGLIYPDKREKKGTEAYRLCSRFLAGAEYRPEYPQRDNVSKLITSLYFKKGNEHVLILWYEFNGPENAPREKSVLLNIPGAASIVRHNIESGAAETMEGETLIKIGVEPIFITWTGSNGVGPSISETVSGR
ncbi:MAG: hypothetical protein LBT68_02480 [Spirochaetales bacterium]|nr:hypothetical protein [Spirochaetales bacterium]